MYKEDILEAFTKKMIENQQDIPPEIAKIVQENLWDLIKGDENV